MPKLKSCRSARKRFKITGSGKVMMKHPGMRHNLSHKKHATKRHMRRMIKVYNKKEAKSLIKILGGGR